MLEGEGGGDGDGVGQGGGVSMGKDEDWGVEADVHGKQRGWDVVGRFVKRECRMDSELGSQWNCQYVELRFFTNTVIFADPMSLLSSSSDGLQTEIRASTSSSRFVFLSADPRSSHKAPRPSNDPNSHHTASHTSSLTLSS